MTNERRIVARGLTVSDRGKNIDLGDDLVVLLRNVEHYGGVTYMDVVTRIQVSSKREVVVHDG
jgi:hypothetical protein